MIELTRLLKVLRKAHSLQLPIDEVIDAPNLGILQQSLPDLAGLKSEESKWAAFSIMEPYRGVILTRELLTSLLCRFVSFKQQMKSGVVPSLWEGNRARAVMFCDGVSIAKEAKKPSLELSMFCLLGEPAGLSFKATISRVYLEYALGKFLGLSFKKYEAPAECIAGSFFQCQVDEDTTGAHITDIDATEVMKKLNRERMEARLAFTKCKTPQLECWTCRKKRKECRLAVWK